MKRMSYLCLLLWPWLAMANENLLKSLDWQALAESGALKNGAIIQTEGSPALKIGATNEGPSDIQVLEINSPPISTAYYAIRGEVKYEQVQGAGYLEMWNHFPPATPGQPGRRYFTRILSDSGPMAKLTGNSGWREFQLPFRAEGAGHPPVKLTVHVNLPGGGEVYLRNLELVEFSNAKLFGTSAHAWWSGRTAGWVGGISGAVFGCLAGLLGILAERGKARGFVTTTTLVLAWAGGVSFVLAVVAIASRQPYHVWFPLMLLGVLMLLLCPFRLKQMREQYRNLELRRMQSLDTQP